MNLLIVLVALTGFVAKLQAQAPNCQGIPAGSTPDNMCLAYCKAHSNYVSGGTCCVTIQSGKDVTQLAVGDQVCMTCNGGCGMAYSLYNGNTGAYYPTGNTGAYYPTGNTGAYYPTGNTGAYYPTGSYYASGPTYIAAPVSGATYGYYSAPTAYYYPAYYGSSSYNYNYYPTGTPITYNTGAYYPSTTNGGYYAGGCPSGCTLIQNIPSGFTFASACGGNGGNWQACNPGITNTNQIWAGYNYCLPVGCSYSG